MDLRRAAYDLAKGHGGPVPRSWEENKAASEKWYRGFRKRHPSLRLWKAQATSLNRVTGLNRPAVKKFYDNIEQALAATGAGPERIINADETGVTTVHKPGRHHLRRGPEIRR